MYTFLYVKITAKLVEQKYVWGRRHLSTDLHHLKELCSQLGGQQDNPRKGKIIITNETWLCKNTICPEIGFLAFHHSTPILKSDLHQAVNLGFRRNPTQNWKHWEFVLSTRSELPPPHLGSRNLQILLSPALGKEILYFRIVQGSGSSRGFQVMEYWDWRLMNFCKPEELAGSSLEKT